MEILERIIKAIPEYLGYNSKEYIADSDRVLRHNLALEMGKRRLALQAVREKMFLRGTLPIPDIVEDSILKMEKLEETFRDSSYEDEYHKKIESFSEDDLERLYDYDIALLDHIEGLNTLIDKLEGQTNSPETFKKELAFLDETLDLLENHFIRREEL